MKVTCMKARFPTSVRSHLTYSFALWASVAVQAAVPVITDIAVVGATPRFSVRSDLGITNQVQYCTNLSQTNWVVLTNLLVTQSPYWFAGVAAPTASQGFYRVEALASTAPPSGMALIPAGWFTMGNTFGEGYAGELPLHTVYLSAFYMDQYEVTKALWDAVYNWAITNGYDFELGAQGKSNNHPTQSMTWYDCVKWCNARSEKEGRTPAYYTDAGLSLRYRSGQVDLQTNWVNWSSGYRLPTEAEWEKAARGGASGQRFPWGSSISESQANYFGDTDYGYDSGPNGYNANFATGVQPYTSPVGYFVANGYGLYDMAGNVWEWCWDWFGSYPSGAQIDPRGPASGSSRALRGGSWNYDANNSRCSVRGYSLPTHFYSSDGFRCARGL
jgi:formylglycine-generating enzyme